MRFRSFYCKCSAMNDIDDAVDGNALLFFKNLTAAEISDLLLETTLSFWDMWRNNPIILQRKLWNLSDIIRKISKNTSMFDELNVICHGSVINKAQLAVASLPNPFKLSVLCALIAWLGPQCKQPLKKDTKEMCDRVAQVVVGSLQNLTI